MDFSEYAITLMMHKKGGEFEQFVPKNIPIKYVDLNINLWSRIKFKLYRAFDTSKKYHLAQLFWQSAKNQIVNYPEHYDVAISWGQGFATYYVAEKISATKKYAWVNIDYQKAGYNWARDKNIYHKFDKIIGVSDFVKESMEQFIDKSKVQSIINIIDRADIENRALVSLPSVFLPNQINLLSVGRLTKQKGFELAIDAIKLLVLQNKNVHLYVIGEGPERAYLQRLIETNELSQNITLLGLKDNPYPYMKNCDIYLQTSRFEGLGRTIIEASILNKPIVCTDFPTAYSILDNEKTGLIVTMTPDAIANSIQRLIDDKILNQLLITNLENQKSSSKEKTLKDVIALLDA
jgi:glycosyltransferase involved in cell wall biosynthesis